MKPGKNNFSNWFTASYRASDAKVSFNWPDQLHADTEALHTELEKTTSFSVKSANQTDSMMPNWYEQSLRNAAGEDLDGEQQTSFGQKPSVQTNSMQPSLFAQSLRDATGLDMDGEKQPSVMLQSITNTNPVSQKRRQSTVYRGSLDIDPTMSFGPRMSIPSEDASGNP